jgi:putative ABC transport system permease protein
MRPFLEHRPLLAVALRDLQSSYGRFAFVIASMALGIAALVGVRGSAESVRRQFLQDTRALLAADVVVQSPTYPTDEQRAAVAQLSSGRTTSTLVVETLTMASSEKSERPQMVDVTVVDPSQYPFYGRVLLQPQQSLPQTLDRNSIAASQMLLVRLNARVGDTIHIAGQAFRVAAVLVSQPDRLFNANAVALPVLMSTDAFASTGLIETGKRLSTRYLFKLPSSAPKLDPLRNQLTHLFPGSQITDFRHGKPELSEALDRATAGLSMICLFALVLACAGVSMTMRSHIRERMDAIATMKSLGATFGQILGIYLLQILLLAVAGSLAGIILGFGLELLLLHFAQSFFSGAVGASWTWQTFLEALITGILSTLLLTFPTLLDLRTIKPLLILRRDFEPDRGRRAVRVALFAAPIVLGLGLLATWLSNSRMIAEYFLVGLLAAILALGLVAQLVLWTARSLSGTTGRVSFLTNYALKSLSRPGNQTIAVLVALGISTGFTLGVFLIQRTILQELSERVPETLPSIILAGVTRYERPGLIELLQQRPEVTAPPEFIPVAQVSLIEVDGKPADQLFTVRSERRFLQPRPAAGVDAPPAGVIVTQGSWWNTQALVAAVAIREDVAQHLHLSPGSQLSFQLGAKLLPVTVSAVYRWQQRSLASSFDFILPLQALTDVPVLYVGGVRLKTGTADAVQSVIYQKFPSVTIFNLSDILAAFESITNEMTLIVKCLAAFVIAAGLGVLTASVAGDRMERFREVAFLKSIGATLRQIVVMSSIEFLLVGLFAGTIGAVFASSFAALLARRLFHFTLHTEWSVIIIALFGTVALAVTVGWLASYRVLRLRPNEALR